MRTSPTPNMRPIDLATLGTTCGRRRSRCKPQNRDIALASVTEDLPQIFKNLSFYINGNTHPPMEELRRMILQRGGEVRPVLRNKGMVKFIIAPMLTQMKFKQFQNYRVVREAWITESCQAGKLLDWSRWKLQVLGGWEEESRKGLEGFMKGDSIQSQRIKEEDFKDEIGVEDPKEALADMKPEDSDPPPSGTARLLARSNLLAPLRSTIPISPGANQDVTPLKETIPPKIHRPEGMWEFYASKESNEDAARLLKNQDWRLRNTAERGNEGGFIDGYYQKQQAPSSIYMESGAQSSGRSRSASI